LNDLYHGQGTIIYKNGETYTGLFKNGIRHGKGELKQKNSSYNGHFMNDMRHGFGSQV